MVQYDLNNFYRATLSPAVVRPSVYLSVTLLHCIQTAEDIIKLLSRSGSPIILILRPRAPVPNSKEKPFNMGENYTGVRKFCDLRLKSSFISETVRHRHMLAMER